MAEGVSRRRPGLAGYFGIKIRALAAEVRKLLVDADRDNDPQRVIVASPPAHLNARALLEVLHA